MEIIPLMLLSLLGSVIALLGGVLFLFSKKLSKVLQKNSVPFAAGVLVTVAILGLLPEAEHKLGEGAFWVVLTAFLAVYIFEHLFFGIHHHDDADHVSGKSFSIPLVIFGDTIHNFIDGVAIGASFLVSPGLGLATAISTFLHEVPHEIGDFGILLSANWEKKNIILVNLFSSLTTILGAFFVYFFVGNPRIMGSLMAISAGVFLYLGASDFLPKIEKGEGGNRFKTLLPLIMGVLIMVLVFVLVPHAD